MINKEAYIRNQMMRAYDQKDVILRAYSKFLACLDLSYDEQMSYKKSGEKHLQDMINNYQWR